MKKHSSNGDFIDVDYEESRVENMEVSTDFIDVDGDDVIVPMSATEKLAQVETYNQLVRMMLQVDEMTSISLLADGKVYSADLGRELWRNVINNAKPILPSNDGERTILVSIYKLLWAVFTTGQYPLLQQLCNYLGESLDSFFSIIKDSGHQKSRAYTWVYQLYDSAASLNSLYSNGNSQSRKWIDQTREYQITTEQKLDLGIQTKKLDLLEKHGRDIVEAMMLEDFDGDMNG